MIIFVGMVMRVVLSSVCLMICLHHVNLTTWSPLTTLSAFTPLLSLCILLCILSLYHLSQWPLLPRELFSLNTSLPSLNACQLPPFFLRWAAASQLLILGPPITYSQTNWPLSPTSLFQTFRFAWGTTLSYQFWVAVLRLSC